ncbi:hypothetical protein [Bizionia arctica]|uniref:Uncharacterized protein n=1 Tax=Bizionia arctica TaxID=1495645 RepID=A0A917LJB5_9FLAO|nr:hypothetical protein [Bizionia arctica]GGG33491.1 hypothetical protein GCM10010976_01510 [Bizionia arctica]
MKIKNLLLILFLGLIFLACSSDDDENPEAENQNIGGYQIGNTYYNTPFAYINDENTQNDNPSDLAIMLSNIDILQSNNIDSGIDMMYVDYLGIDFEIGPKDLLDYRITENASRVNGYIEGGTRLLDNMNQDLYATQINFIINSFSDTHIDFEFTFTRQDGEIVTGEYSGTYVNVSS